MPATINSAIGLMIISLGIIGVIISLLITTRKKFILALMLSIAVMLMGTIQFVSTNLRQLRTTRRISRLQRQQRTNLEAMRKATPPPPTPRPATATAKPKKPAKK